MIEVMIPDLFWDGEYWCIKRVRSVKDLKEALRYADGTVRNLVLVVEDDSDLKAGMRDVFINYAWLDKTVVRCGDHAPRVYARKGSWK